MSASEDQFEIEMGKPGRDQAPKLRSVRAAVRAATCATAGRRTRIAPRTGMRAHFRKSQGGAAKVAQIAQRRVVVKIRYAAHGGGKGAPLRLHQAAGCSPGRGLC